MFGFVISEESAAFFFSVPIYQTTPNYRVISELEIMWLEGRSSSMQNRHVAHSTAMFGIQMWDLEVITLDFLGEKCACIWNCKSFRALSQRGYRNSRPTFFMAVRLHVTALDRMKAFPWNCIILRYGEFCRHADILIKFRQKNVHFWRTASVKVASCDVASELRRRLSRLRPRDFPLTLLYLNLGQWFSTFVRPRPGKFFFL
jgi:hypothetical protein